MMLPREKWTDDRLDALNAKVAEGFARVDGDIRELKGEMNQRFDKVDQRFDKVDARFDKIDERFDRLNDRINYLTGGLFSAARCDHRRPHRPLVARDPIGAASRPG